MSATHSSTNRVAPFLGYDEPPAPEPQIPVGPIEKMGALSDTVFAALAALRGQLRDPDTKIAQKAALGILSFEATRMRHGGRVAGTLLPEQVLPRCEPMELIEEVRYPDPGACQVPKVGRPPHILIVSYVRQMKTILQKEADLRGLGEVISDRRARDEVEKELEHPTERAKKIHLFRPTTQAILTKHSTGSAPPDPNHGRTNRPPAD